MTRIHSLLIVLSMFIFISCNESEHWDLDDYRVKVWTCRLAISDSLGQDLVKPLRYDPHLISTAILDKENYDYYREMLNTDYSLLDTYTNENVKMYVDISTSPRIMTFVCSRSSDSTIDLDNYRETIYKITYPDLFGDNEEHVFTTYWENDKYKSKLRTFLDISSNYVCSQLVIDGKSYEAGDDGIIRIVIGK